MRIPFARSSREIPAAPAAPARLRYGVRRHGERADLTCSACQQVIAYAIPADHVEADAGYYVDAHSRFCVAVAAGV